MKLLRPSFLLLVLLLFAATLRCYRLGELNLWYDEAYSVRMIEFPPAELIDRASRDCHPPLYWLILKSWASLCGTSIATLRVPSVFFGVATVAAAFAFVRELPRLSPPDRQGDESSANATALLAAGLVTASPIHIEWSQEIRMYSLGTFLCAIGTWLLIRALTSTRYQAAWWTVYGMNAAAILYTHYFGLFVLTAHGLFAGGRILLNKDRVRLRFFLLTAGGIALAWLPWLPTLLARFDMVQDAFPQPALTWDVFSDIMWRMFLPDNVKAPDPLIKTVVIELAALVVISLFLCDSAPAALCSLCALIPFDVIVTLSFATQNLISRHRLLFGHLFLLVGVALLVQKCPRRRMRMALAVILASLSALSSAKYLQYRTSQCQLPGVAEAMSFLDSRRLPDEPVLFLGPMLYLQGIPYAQKQEGIYVLGDIERVPYYQGSPVMRPEEFLEIHDIPSNIDTLWVVDTEKWRARIRSSWQPIGDRRFAHRYATVVVRQFSRRENKPLLPAGTSPQ